MNDEKIIDPARKRAVVIAGGGTGGHLYPGLALADEFSGRPGGARILYVGVKGKMEEKAVPAAGYDFYGLRVAGIKGRSPVGKVAAAALSAKAVFECRRVLKSFRPDLVVGVGGYSSGPVGLAAGTIGVPLVLQEQNTVPGLTNRLLGRLARRIFLAFEGAAPRFPQGRTTATGNPVRREALGAGREVGSTTGLHVLVLGGSRGARGVNGMVTEAIGVMGAGSENLEILHQTGAEDREMVAGAYERIGVAADVRVFVEAIGEKYDWADVVISRAGAGAVSEIAANGRPALLIPYPYAAAGHQHENARWLADREGALIFDEKDEGSAARLARTLQELCGDRTLLKKMAFMSRRSGRKDAARRIVDECLQVLNTQRG